MKEAKEVSVKLVGGSDSFQLVFEYDGKTVNGGIFLANSFMDSQDKKVWKSVFENVLCPKIAE